MIDIALTILVIAGIIGAVAVFIEIDYYIINRIGIRKGAALRE